LEFYGGPGVQHIALAPDDIIETVRALRLNDVSFLRVPNAYYEMLPERVGQIDEDMRDLAELGILADRDRGRLLAADFHQARGRSAAPLFEVIERRRQPQPSAKETSKRFSRPSNASSPPRLFMNLCLAASQRRARENKWGVCTKAQRDETP